MSVSYLNVVAKTFLNDSTETLNFVETNYFVEGWLFSRFVQSPTSLFWQRTTTTMGAILTVLGFITSLFVSQETLNEIDSIFEVSLDSLGFSKHTMLVNGDEDRTYFEFTAPNNDTATSRSLLITLHGTFGAPSGLFTPGVNLFGQILDDVTMRGGTIIAPQGTPLSFFGLFYLPPLPGLGYLWNDYGKGFIQPKSDDVAFIEHLIEWSIQERNVDPSRVFITGLSGGSSLIYRLLNERSYLFRAAAPLIASVLVKAPPPESYTPLPILSVHATKDPYFTFTGGNTLFFDSRSVDETLELFANLNGQVDDRTILPLPDDTPDDECSAEYISYDTEDVPPVEAYIVQGGGHTVPGTDLYIFWKPFHPIQFGKLCNDVFDFAPILVDFFDRYGL